ncbi:MAG: gliding motility protein GldN [Chitinophagaceae bacterium]
MAIEITIGQPGKKGGTTRTKQSAPAKNPFQSGNAKPASNNPFESKPANNAPTTGGVNPFESKPATSQPPAGGNPFESKTGSTTSQPTGSNQPPAQNKSKLPIVFVPGAGNNPLADSSIIPSMRMESAIESTIKDRVPLMYDYVREDDAVFKQTIWRVIDAREKLNMTFKYPAEDDNGSQLFFSILFKSVVEDSVVAFDDERFTKPYTLDKFKTKFSGGLDTSDVIDLDGVTVLRREVRMKEFPIDSVYQFMIKEDVFFDKESSRLLTRIVGIAPMGPTILPSGQVIAGPSYPYFWLYYPDIRKTLARKQVYNPKNSGNRLSWEDLFENRTFSSYIVKTNKDNYKDQWLRQKYPNDTLWRLLEGEKIKEKIFNYEQNLWEY